MTEQHTPTQFVVENDPDYEGFYSIYTNTQGVNAEIAGKIGARNNADLFAAAPETAAERDQLRADKAELVKALDGAAETLGDFSTWLLAERHAQRSTHHLTDWTGLFSFIDAANTRYGVARAAITKAKGE